MYRENYSDELNTWYRDNDVGFKLLHEVVFLKDKFPEVEGSIDSPSDKQIKKNYSELKRAFKEAYEDI